MCLAGFIYQQLNPQGVHGYLDFYSNCIEVACSIWAVLNAVILAYPNSHGIVYGIVARTGFFMI